MEPWQWAQSFDEGFHYGHMTTNLAEEINPVLLKIQHLPISSVFSATFYKLATLMPRVGQHQECNGCKLADGKVDECRITKTISRRLGVPPRSYGVDLRNRRCNYRRFRTLHNPCAHVVAACANVSLNVEQFIDEVYTLKRTLHV
ncbi:hypothetical protein GOBAR_DD08581 [Gossypium barbadense]|nr:hypothetical protein GOBAR_DD08581 [Gossypium barbadense]